MDFTVSMEARGRIFRDSPELMRQVAERSVRELVELGNERLAEVLRPRPAGVYLSFAEARKGQYSTGHYRQNIHPKSQGLLGTISDGGVIYGPWLEGTGSRNQTTRFKGYGSFRKTAQFMRGKVREVLQKHLIVGIRKLES